MTNPRFRGRKVNDVQAGSSPRLETKRVTFTGSRMKQLWKCNSLLHKNTQTNKEGQLKLQQDEDWRQADVCGANGSHTDGWSLNLQPSCLDLNLTSASTDTTWLNVSQPNQTDAFHETLIQTAQWRHKFYPRGVGITDKYVRFFILAEASKTSIKDLLVFSVQMEEIFRFKKVSGLHRFRNVLIS